MITKKCLYCGKEFKTSLPLIKIGKGKYCSSFCFSQSTRGRTPWNKGKKTGIVPKTAFKKGRTCGKNNSHWKGGKTIDQNRLFIWKPEHPFANNKGYVRHSRLVMEQMIGRYLTRKEVVHHIDGDPSNDNPENLMLFSNNKEHIKYRGSSR